MKKELDNSNRNKTKLKTSLAALCMLSLGTSVHAADFKIMKAGEWRSELVESSLGPATQLVKPSTFCIKEKDQLKDWEASIKREMAKSNMDCKLNPTKQEAAVISYAIDCKATEGEKGKSTSFPAGSTFDGTVVMTHESDTSYLVDYDTKVKGLKMSDTDLSKVPANQRAAVAAAFAMQAGGMNLKTKQRLSFVKATCEKK